MSLKPEAINRHSPISRKALNRRARTAKAAASRVRRRTERGALRRGDLESLASGHVTRGWCD